MELKGLQKLKNERNNMTTYEASQKLTGDLNKVLQDADALLKATAGAGGEIVKEAQSRLASTLQSAKATCEQLKEKTVETAKATDHLVREHPYESIGAALSVGLLIGALVGRRN
jgi:ElaB/YqjD/DUF883 family membrane-anchored ribosome-binding protein